MNYTKTMKRLLFIIIPLIFFGCKNTISYELRNHTTYDVILVDTKHVDNPEYFVKANTTITIEHYDSGDFRLKDHKYPIEVFNGFSSTSINNMANFELSVNNNSNKQFELKILNSKHFSTSTFTITPNFFQDICIYIDTQPKIELLYENKKYTNYVINNNSLIIF